MTTAIPPISPKLQKGSIIAIDQETKQRTEIVFQYNPETLTRRLTAQTASGNYDRSEAFRLKGPPEESISLEIEIDATDDLEAGDSNAQNMGIHPKLAALELLLYPKSQLIIANETLANFGIIEIVPPEVPLTLFSWGPNRIVPVRLTSFSITEEAFDPNLNPILAKVSLDLMVLNYMDLGLPNEGGQTFMAHQKQKEMMAKQIPGNPGI
jgi:Contractile injection system tube protein